jgi:hypothetical protein
MTYQVNFHSFAVSKELSNEDLDRIQSPTLQQALHEAVIAKFEELCPDLKDKVQVGLGRIEVCYLGL